MGMEEPKLIIDSEKEFVLENELTSIGRASDNDISFPDDSNVSRYHAEIEQRGDDFWIIELGSFNGTTVNGERIETEKPLNDGDVVLFGGTSEIEILLTQRLKPEAKDEKTSEDQKTAPAAAKPEAPSEPKPSKFPVVLILAAVVCGLAVILVVAAVLFYFNQEVADCSAKATIIKPENNDVLKEITQIEIELTGGECVRKASYRVEDKEFASSESPPFSVSLSPDEFSEFSDGLIRNLKVVLFDEKGKEISQSNEVAIFVETLEVEKPTLTSGNGSGNTSQTPTNKKSNRPKNNQISASDSIQLSKKIISQFSGSHKYKFDRRFLQEVRKRNAEYVSEGYFERADKYRDVINIQFIQERNLDPPLGFILAMSRSRFIPPTQPDGAGLWRMANKLIVENSYNGLCGSEPITSETQKCAAIASSSYLKDIVLNVFEGDIIYGIAAFGMSSQEAAAWKSTLPANRTDFWKVIKNPKQREEVVRFFAAAMVIENPQKFGLKNDRPISKLYPVRMR